MVWLRSDYAAEGARDSPGEMSRGQIIRVQSYVSCKRVLGPWEPRTDSLLGKDVSDLLFKEIFSLVVMGRLDTRKASVEVRRPCNY